MFTLGPIDFVVFMGIPSIVAWVLAIRQQPISSPMRFGLRSGFLSALGLGFLSLSLMTASAVIPLSPNPVDQAAVFILPPIIAILSFLLGAIPSILVTWLVSILKQPISNRIQSGVPRDYD